MTLESIFLIMDAIFQGGRMFVGGISVAFLFSRGLSAVDIASIKTMQAIVVFVAEVPTGLIADKFGRKFGLLAATLSTFIGFFFYLFGNEISHYLLGEFFLALSLCWWSGSYEAWVCSETKIDESLERTKHFFHLNTVASQSAVVLFGWFGGFLSGINGYQWAYYAAMAAMGTLLPLILLTKETQTKSSFDLREESTSKVFLSAVMFSIRNKKVLWLVAFSILLQFLAQPLLHYWQPLFLLLNNHLGPQGLGNIFSISTAATAIVGWALRKVHSNYERWISSFLISAYLLMSLANTLIFVVTLFLLLMVGYIFLRTRISAQLSQSAPAHIRASVMSIGAFLSRLGMLGSFGLIGLLFSNEKTVDLSKYQRLFLYEGIIVLGIALSVMVIIRLQNIVKLSSPTLRKAPL